MAQLRGCGARCDATGADASCLIDFSVGSLPWVSFPHGILKGYEATVERWNCKPNNTRSTPS